MSYVLRRIQREAKENARAHRAEAPGKNLGQMTFAGVELAQQQKAREWKGVPRFTPEDEEDSQ